MCKTKHILYTLFNHADIYIYTDYIYIHTDIYTDTHTYTSNNWKLDMKHTDT